MPLLLRRREILAGIGLWTGAPLLGAICRTMTPEALGQPTTRKRLLLYMNVLSLGEDTTNGAHLPSFIPSGNPDGSVNLGPGGFAALEPYRNEITFLRNLHGPFNQTGHNNIWMLTSAQIPGLTRAQFDTASVPKPPHGISIDRLIAREIGKSDPHMSIHLSATGVGGSENCQSADGPDQRFPMMKDPVTTYAELFGAGLPMVSGNDPAAIAAYLAKRRSLFDFLRADISKLNARLAAPERAKLAQYTDSIRAIEQRLASLENPANNAACTKPAVPTAAGDTLIITYPQVDPGVAASMVDMATAALAGGLTRVAVISWEGQRGYSFLGDPFVGIHGMFHGLAQERRKPEMPLGEMIKRHHAYHAQNVATIRQRLGAVREGDKTVADNTLIGMLNTSGQYHHGGTSYGGQFGLLLGSCGGYFKTGRFIKYPMAERSTSDLFVSIANAMGVPLTRFGQQETPDASVALRLPIGPVNKGPLPELT
jgi:hypothetical protein